MALSPICLIDGCGKNSYARDMCSMHYSRWRRGLSEAPPRFTRESPSAKFIREQVVGYDHNDCLLWPLHRNSEGYACMSRGGKKVGAYRVVCELVHGDPPSQSHQAAHSCGNGRLGCVNPRHLRWATPKENSADRSAHGTQACEKHPNSKLTNAEAIEIYRKKGTATRAHVARAYGISPTAVFLIWNGHSYRKVTQAS